MLLSPKDSKKQISFSLSLFEGMPGGSLHGPETANHRSGQGGYAREDQPVRGRVPATDGGVIQFPQKKCAVKKNYVVFQIC
jgi:hypothetical protein